jgi:catechol 2,3-dioxygenase-like lactoylglutathione lyase family enzyme
MTMDERPAVWIGHTVMGVPDPHASAVFFSKLGMRPIEEGDGIAILELRGGTHLLLLKTDNAIAPDAEAPFDLMVEDVDAAHKQYSESGLAPSEIQTAPFHRRFTLTEPGGHQVTINSSHVEGPV